MTDDSSTVTPQTFEQELERLINRYSQERASNTPDFILAQYLLMCLAAWNHGVTQREQWYGRLPTIAPVVIHHPPECSA
jgi:hypothetical protein